MKVVAILPGYKCEETLKMFVQSLPKKYLDEVIFVDDCSPDESYLVAKKIKGLKVFKTKKNLGYGGNVKMCLTKALQLGAEIMIEIHPDGEYGVDGIREAIEAVNEGAGMVLGNRFTKDKNALKSGMYWWKYWVSRGLNAFDNLWLGTAIPDLHQGFRVYTRKQLEVVDWKKMSDGYIFSFEIIVATIKVGLQIASVPVSTKYVGEKRGASLKASFLYTLKTFGVLIKSSGFRVTPGMTEVAYPKNYWRWTGIRKIVFEFCQTRRVRWVKEYLKVGSVLDVGCGENKTKLKTGFAVTGIDPNVKKSGVIKKDFLDWQTKEKYKAVVFWESLEHTDCPEKYLKKASRVLEPNGLLFVEHPRLNSLEARVFRKDWYHLDPPRHLTNLSDEMVEKMAKNAGFKKIKQIGIFAGEYAVWGLLASIWGGGRKLEKSLRWWKWLYLLPLLSLMLVIELSLWLTGQSPIGLYVGKKM